jgi:hypothetical protein
MKLNRKFLLSAFFLFVVAQFFAQKKELDVRDLNTDEFPKVTGKLWVRNPDGVKTNGVKFFENEVPLSITFNLFQKSDSLPTNKSILFLVLNSSSSDDLRWYQNVIKASLTNESVKAGDKFAVASFTCKENGRFVFPNELDFTDDIEKISGKIDSIKYQRKSSLYKGKSQVYLALNEALSLYEQKNLELPSGIIILSDDRNLDPDFAGETPVQRSRRLDIPVYCICLDRYEKTYEVEDLCTQTYGLYNAFSSQDEASQQLKSFLAGFIDRHEGLFYPFSYESTLEKDGKPHTIKIDSQEDQSAFVLTTPNKTILEWIADNLILSIILFLLFVGLVILLILMIKKNKLKKQELELKQQQQIQEMERQQADAKMKLSSQEAEIRNIHEQERKHKEEIERKRISEQILKEDEAQFAKMLERGNLPWFEFKVGDNSGSYQIASPRLSVGRDNSSDWVIPHPTVSRRHFELSFKDYIYTIKDLGSSNGLLVNGQQVKEIELRHGDLIQAGDLILTFHI